MTGGRAGSPAAEAPGHAIGGDPRTRLEYLGFTDDDARRLQAIGREVEDLIDPAVERFYEHLMRYPVAALLSEPGRLERLKGFQRQYLRDLFSGDYGPRYFDSRHRIGEAHVRIGLEPQWYLGMYGVYRATFVPRILERFGAALDRGASHILALDKILLLDGELALDAYIAAFTRDLRELGGQVEQRNRELERHSAGLEELVSSRTNQLRLSEAKYRGIVDHAADGIILIDNAEVIQSWNKGAQTMFGYSPDEVIGRKFHMLIPTGAESELTYIRGEMERAGILRNFETVRVAKDGTLVHVSITRTLLRNEAGEPMGSSAIVRDITAIRNFEERMYRAERVASLGWLASEIAHEVGTPLNVISGRAEHLLRGLERNDAKRRPLEIIVAQIDRISRVMHRALQLVRDPRADETGPRVADAATVTHEVLEFFEVKLVSRRISVKRKLEPVVVDLTRLDLEQVLFNLLQNAVDAMPDGGTLTLCSQAAGEEGLLQVSDTGVGIPAQNLGRIFEPLFTTKDPGRGTGLGLALVTRIVQRHRGAIHVESQVGKGTCFTLRLPLAGR